QQIDRRQRAALELACQLFGVQFLHGLLLRRQSWQRSLPARKAAPAARAWGTAFEMPAAFIRPASWSPTRLPRAIALLWERSVPARKAGPAARAGCTASDMPAAFIATVSRPP